VIYDDVTQLIGDTPLLRLDPARHGLPGTEVYAKLESANPFGSVKDRIAWGMLREHLPDAVAAGRTLVEASSGNTAKALAVLAALHGLPLRVLTNRAKVPEVRDVLSLLGVDLEELPGLSECPDPGAPDDVFTRIAALTAAEPDRYLHLSQYTNPDNVRTHADTTGEEIAADLPRVDLLVGGLGTTGSTRGTAERLRRDNPDLQVVGVVSTAEDFIPGIRSETEMWDVGLFRRDLYTAIAPVRSADAVEATLALARDHGVLAGPTSGAAYHALRTHVLGQQRAGQQRAGQQRAGQQRAGQQRAGQQTGRPTVAVFVACDRIEWYLSYLRARRPDLFGGTRRTGPADLTGEQVAAAPTITAEALHGRLHDPALLLVDTRGALAYRVGHVPGSVNLTDTVLDEQLWTGNPFPPSRTVVLVCPVGDRARRYAAFLQQAGQDAAALAGGVVAWRDAGYPLERSPSRTG
jgi:cysteine synthase/rhodanese-related sulfurtransferase